MQLFRWRAVSILGGTDRDSVAVSADEKNKKTKSCAWKYLDFRQKEEARQSWPNTSKTDTLTKLDNSNSSEFSVYCHCESDNVNLNMPIFRGLRYSLPAQLYVR